MDGGREGWMEGGREGGRDGGREGGSGVKSHKKFTRSIYSMHRFTFRFSL